MDFKARLVEFARKQYGMGMTRFEEFTGINSGTINKIRDGISTTTLTKIAAACPELNIRWLLGEDTDMLNDGAGAGANTIPLLPFSAVAGSLSENTPIDATTAIEQYVIPDFTARGADCAIRVDGDSMYPRYSNGEILALRVIHDPTFFQWGKVYVLATNQGCVIKKLFPDPDDPNGIICHSENTANYPDYRITKQDIFGVAIVVGHAGIE